MRTQFQLSREVIFDPASPIIHLKQVMIDGDDLDCPVYAVMVIVAILAPLALGGWVFTWEAITPKLQNWIHLKASPGCLPCMAWSNWLRPY